MKAAKYELDMSQGSLVKNIISFAIPYMLTTILQLFYNAADIVVVSRWAGSTAMASVGATSSLTNLLVNFFVGISVGASVVVSRRYGANDQKGLSHAVHTSVLISMIAGITAMVIGLVFSKPLLIFMDTPKGKVLDGAILYMKIIFLGTPASLMYNFGAAILRSVGDTKRPLYILALSGIVNVLLNLLFVIGFGMGVEGVAIATIASQYVSVVMVYYTLTCSDAIYKVDFKELRIHKKELSEILRIGIPSGIQSSLFNLANAVIQSGVNSFGTAAIAGNTAASNIENFAYAVKNSFAQATITAVSQNYGAKNEKRLKKSVYTALLLMTVCTLLMSIFIVLFAKPILSIYITDSAEAMSYGIRRLVITCIPYFLSGGVEVLSGYIRGLGYSTTSTVNTFIGACLFRMVWVIAILPLNRTFEMLYLCWPLSWSLVIVMHLITISVVYKKAMKKMYEE